MSSPPPTPGAFLVLALVAALTSACAGDDQGALALGEACGDDARCASRFCDRVCRDPGADDDGDGVDNRDERARGTDPDRADTDRDGLSDLIEGLDDSDDDGRIDALESAMLDADLDCLSAQLDPDESTAESQADVLALHLCRRAGVCAGADVGARCDRLAVGDVTIAIVVCDYGLVADFDGAIETSCDGLDNDCDGATDEDLGVIDSTGSVRALGASCQGTGACAAAVGVVECDPAGRVRCSVDAGGSEAPTATTDVDCDAIDNDCDGATDEHVSWLDPSSGELRAFGAPCAGLGACGLGLGVVECAASSSRGICSLEPGGSDDASAPETCNGLDDDCDGRTDEDLAWIGPDGRALAVGQACGLGACAGGIVTCGGGYARCSSASLAADEVCNGLDDDCDGATAELADLTLDCPALGVCADLELVSVTCDPLAGALVCTLADPDGAREPGGETRCNGLDDDCDGDTDEDLTPLGGDALGGPCAGRGACAGPGFVVCAADGVGVRCSADVTDAVETCNAIDDDCDGETDEALAEPPGACSDRGVCRDYADIPAACTRGAWRCEHEADPAWEPEEITCDGLDNDCDGDTDEALPRRPRGTWTVAPGSPSERLRWPMASAPGGAWLFGGVATSASADATSPTLLGDLWRYDPAAVRWEREPSSGGPSARGGHALVWEPHHGVLVVHGGFTSVSGTGPLGPDGAPVGSMFVFDPRARAWSVVVDRSAGERPASWYYRRYHALLATGDGRLVMHGGLVSGLDAYGAGMLSAPLVVTGTLTLADGAWSIAWEVADADLAPSTAWRFGHALGALGDTLVSLGGRARGGAPLGTIDRLDAALAWSPLPDLTLTGDFPALEALDGGLLVAVLGGTHVLTTDPPAVTPVLAPEGPPIARAAALVVASEGDVLLVEGATPDGDAGRRTFTLDTSGPLAWIDPTPWRLPGPRVGASLVADPDGRIVLIGGARRVPSGALQDAWRFDPEDASWTPLVVPSLPAAIDAERPAVVDATALWDAGADRVLLFGGVDVTRDPIARVSDLWAFDLVSFSRFEARGDPPPPGAREILVGLDSDVALVFGEPDGRIALWRVALDGNEATFRELTALPAQAGRASPRELIAAGRLGARVALVAGEDDALVVHAWDPATGRWAPPRPLDGDALAIGTTSTASSARPFVWEPTSELVLVLGHDAFTTLDLALGTVASVPLVGVAPPGRPALVSSPSRGVLMGFGGLHLTSLADPRGPASARAFRFDLECAR